MKKKILIVDDSALTRKYLNSILAKNNFEVIEAIDGSEGLLKVKENPDICLILSDMNMLPMSGIEMTEALKREGQYAIPPVLISTADSEASLIESAKKAGVKGFILKPIKAEQLLAIVKKITGPH